MSTTSSSTASGSGSGSGGPPATAAASAATQAFSAIRFVVAPATPVARPVPKNRGHGRRVGAPRALGGPGDGLRDRGWALSAVGRRLLGLDHRVRIQRLLGRRQSGDPRGSATLRVPPVAAAHSRRIPHGEDHRRAEGAELILRRVWGDHRHGPVHGTARRSAPADWAHHPQRMRRARPATKRMRRATTRRPRRDPSTRPRRDGPARLDQSSACEQDSARPGSPHYCAPPEHKTEGTSHGRTVQGRRERRHQGLGA